MDLHVAYFVNSCQGKDDGVLFRLNKFLIIGTIFNLAKVNTVPCMFTAILSLSQTSSR